MYPLHPRPRPGNLREVAEKIEELTGLRVQVLGGSLVMSPPPTGKHAGVVFSLRRQMDRALPDGPRAYENSSVMMPDDRDDYATPDLIVLPDAWAEDDDWLADPVDVALAVEVISPSEKARGISEKADWYALAGVVALLAIDPRKGTWVLYTRPANGGYQDVMPGKYGETVGLPEPLGLDVETGQFPVYGDKPRR
ncbi:Uma2 family endonuclease [Streptomyces sp. NPDC086554]|uniref:Uma2 family endonuclease n=1 Tax=Streptomyces sp. NPDC086554 TaxID=3154864 RepID=UPI003420D1DC